MTASDSHILVKHLADHLVVNSPTCGKIHDILKTGDYTPLGLAISINIKPTQAHYHRTFDEIYFVLDGQMKLQVYDPTNNQTHTYELKANELCVITKGLHHKILEASTQNRLCVISTPPFHSDDEHLSDKI